MTLEELAAKFTQLVQMLGRDLPALKNGMNTVSQQNAVLAQRVAELEKKLGAAPATPPDPDQQVVGVHPITRQPVTAAEVKADPKLRMRMQFSEEDA